MSKFNFFLVWVFGFFAPLSFDLFVETFVFEWLAWNGTEKNDSRLQVQTLYTEVGALNVAIG